MAHQHVTWQKPNEWKQIPNIIFVPPQSNDGSVILKHFTDQVIADIKTALNWKLSKGLPCKPGPITATSAAYALLGVTNFYLSNLNCIAQFTIVNAGAGLSGDGGQGDDASVVQASDPPGLSMDTLLQVLKFQQDNTVVEDSTDAAENAAAAG